MTNTAVHHVSRDDFYALLWDVVSDQYRADICSTLCQPKLPRSTALLTWSELTAERRAVIGKAIFDLVEIGAHNRRAKSPSPQPLQRKTAEA